MKATFKKKMYASNINFRQIQTKTDCFITNQTTISGSLKLSFETRALEARSFN